MINNIKLLLPLFLLLGACAQIIPDKVTTEQTGNSTYTINVTITFGFLDQLRQLCEDENATTRFDSNELHRKVIADCIVDKLKGLRTSTVSVPSQVESQYCSPNSDLTAFSPEQIVQIQALCASLNNTP